ncbi:PH domain-containing protein [Falsibacillus pallidus]|uniref:PH domain-containing protein n=1 Tax=Falsibacillus pallidus TaxID=493781 RepID=UPI003D9683C5
MADLNSIMTWTFNEEVDVPKDIVEILVNGETAEAAYKTIRDVAVVTNKRIIIADRQGLTGKKVEIYTIPFKSIIMYSSENGGGLLDTNAELELWTEAGKLKLNVNKKVDIRKLDRLIGTYIL